MANPAAIRRQVRSYNLDRRVTWKPRIFVGRALGVAVYYNAAVALWAKRVNNSVAGTPGAGGVAVVYQDALIVRTVEAEVTVPQDIIDSVAPASLEIPSDGRASVRIDTDDQIEVDGVTHEVTTIEELERRRWYLVDLVEQT